MSFPPRRTKFAWQGDVDTSRIINWDHPLTRGLVAQWAVIPNSGWRGGNILRDLTRGGKNPHDGTFGASTAAPTWSGNRGRRGGFGSLSFDGSNDYVDCGSQAGMDPLSQMTVWCWVRTSNVAQSFAMFVTKGGFGGAGGPGWNLRFNSTNATPQFCVYVNGGWYDQGAYSVSLAMTNDVWAFVVGVYDGTKIYTYVNGVVSGSVAASGSMSSTATTLQIGRRNDGFNFAGLIDDVGLSSRGLSASQVAALYQESCRGYPEMWNWMGARTWFAPPATPATPGAFQAAWARRPVVIGTGIF